MNIVVFDVETKELAPRGEQTEADIAKLGISCACAFDYLTGEYSTYMEDNIGHLWYRLTTAALVVGFNIRRFDIPALYGEVENDLGQSGSAPEELEEFAHSKSLVLANVYDLYEESKIGANAGKYDKGFKCDDHLRALYGWKDMKTAAGAEAPKMYREKRMGELVNYCLGDVHRERRIFEQAWVHGTLKSMGFKGGMEAYRIVTPQEKLCIDRSTRLPYLFDNDPTRTTEPVVHYGPVPLTVILPPVKPVELPVIHLTQDAVDAMKAEAAKGHLAADLVQGQVPLAETFLDPADL